jgi:NAD(P)-dependent dehydrogenase (short-subunit alcohol dehydrogenase family)
MACAVLITGASAGIGLHTAITLARAGYPVVAGIEAAGSAAAVRAAAEAAQVAFEVRVLDVTSDESVQECVGHVLAEHEGVHALVNTTGSARLGTLEQVSLPELRAVWERDVLGVVRMTRAVLPHLRAQRGRLVTVTGIGGAVGRPFHETDCAAKFAVEGLMESLAPVAAALGVRVSVVEPTTTDPAFDGPVSGPYADLLANYLGRTGDPAAGGQSAAEVAAVVLDALCSPDPAFRYQTSAAATRFVATKLTDVHGTGVQELIGSWLR